MYSLLILFFPIMLNPVFLLHKVKRVSTVTSDYVRIINSTSTAHKFRKVYL